MSFIKIFSGNMFEVDQLKQKLQQQGINPIVRDTEESARLAGFGALKLEKELFVHSDQEIEVQKIISDLV